jgi:hypothetical protein
MSATRVADVVPDGGVDPSRSISVALIVPPTGTPPVVCPECLLMPIGAR